MIRPGDRVDIYAAFDVGRGMNTLREVSLMMSDVVILSTGINIMNSIPRILEVDANGKEGSIIPLASDTKYSTVTFEATPKESQDLIYLEATSPGNIYLALRNPNDRKPPNRLPSSNADTVMARVGIAPDSSNSSSGQIPMIPQARPGNTPNTGGPNVNSR